MAKKYCSAHCLSWPREIIGRAKYNRAGWRWCNECERVVPPNARGKAREKCPCCENQLEVINRLGVST